MFSMGGGGGEERLQFFKDTELNFQHKTYFFFFGGGGEGVGGAPPREALEPPPPPSIPTNSALGIMSTNMLKLCYSRATIHTENGLRYTIL